MTVSTNRLIVSEHIKAFSYRSQGVEVGESFGGVHWPHVWSMGSTCS